MGSEPIHDVVGIGNAIVDVITSVDFGFIEKYGLTKGSMTLIDAERAKSLYAMMPPAMEISGGSAANTAAGVASFGGSAAFVGKVRADQLGDVFVHDLRAAGVVFDVAPGANGPPTARSLIQVTPDGERTMNTYLGMSRCLEPADVDPQLVAASSIIYCEGYLWDVECAKEAIRFAADVAVDAGRKVSLTLSDSYCVDRHRVEWLDLISDKVELVFANETEICALFETDDFDAAVVQGTQIAETLAVTRGAAGSVVASGSKLVTVPAIPVDKIVDATGAGDLYAAGFLYGIANGADLARCAHLGGVAATEVISHVGARPQVLLGSLV